jgi:hypothetical protein
VLRRSFLQTALATLAGFAWPFKPSVRQSLPEPWLPWLWSLPASYPGGPVSVFTADFGLLLALPRVKAFSLPWAGVSMRRLDGPFTQAWYDVRGTLRGRTVRFLACRAFPLTDYFKALGTTPDIYAFEVSLTPHAVESLRPWGACDDPFGVRCQP